MKRVAAALFLCLCLWPAAQSAYAGDPELIEFPPENNGSIDFHMPSNNVECGFTPRGSDSTEGGLAQLYCDRAEPRYIHVEMGERGPVHIVKDPDEQPCCGGYNNFPYGRAWRMAPFTCESRATGIICTRDDGHGFHVSKAKVEAF